MCLSFVLVIVLIFTVMYLLAVTPLVYVCATTRNELGLFAGIGLATVLAVLYIASTCVILLLFS